MRGAVQLLVGGLLLGATSASAYECKRSSAHPMVSLHWPVRAIPYGVEATVSLPASTVAAAFDAWAGPACTDLTFAYRGVVPDGAELSKVRSVQVGWVAGDRSPEAVALTRTRYAVASGEIRRATIELNEEGFRLIDASRGCSPAQGDGYDALSVLTHEVGHLLGFDHTQAFTGQPSDPTMAPTVDACDVSKRDLETDDRAGICHVYPAARAARGCTPLPDRVGGYVDNRAFGCTSSAGARGGAVLWGVAGWLLVWLSVRRETCPERRSGG